MLLKTESAVVRITTQDLDNFAGLYRIDDDIVLETHAPGRQIRSRILLAGNGRRHYEDWRAQIEAALAERKQWRKWRGIGFLVGGLTLSMIVGSMLLPAPKGARDAHISKAHSKQHIQQPQQRGARRSASTASAPVLGAPNAMEKKKPEEPAPAESARYPQITDPNPTMESDDPIDPPLNVSDSTDPLFGSADRHCVFRPENVHLVE